MLVIVSNPRNNRPRPVTISPAKATLGNFFPRNKRNKTPTKVNEIIISVKGKEEEVSPPNATIWAVMVVPIFAPIIYVAAWTKLITPAFTKPTTMMVVAPLDCIIMVAKVPIPTPANLDLAVLANNFFSPPVASFSVEH